MYTYSKTICLRYGIENVDLSWIKITHIHLTSLGCLRPFFARFWHSSYLAICINSYNAKWLIIPFYNSIYYPAYILPNFNYCLKILLIFFLITAISSLVISSYLLTIHWFLSNSFITHHYLLLVFLLFFYFL